MSLGEDNNNNNLFIYSALFNMQGDQQETSRNHQAYKERTPRDHNIIRNKGCEGERLN